LPGLITYSPYRFSCVVLMDTVCKLWSVLAPNEIAVLNVKRVIFLCGWFCAFAYIQMSRSSGDRRTGRTSTIWK